eukprot:3832490-Pleurochrysis_carterae.AAC.3
MAPPRQPGAGDADGFEEMTISEILDGKVTKASAQVQAHVLSLQLCADVSPTPSSSSLFAACCFPTSTRCAYSIVDCACFRLGWSTLPASCVRLQADYFPGLVPLIFAYLESIDCDGETLELMKVYFDFIRKRVRALGGVLCTRNPLLTSLSCLRTVALHAVGFVLVVACTLAASTCKSPRTPLPGRFGSMGLPEVAQHLSRPTKSPPHIP